MATVTGLTADATAEMIEVAKDRNNHTGTQLASTISDLTESVQDLMSSTIVAGANATVTYNDSAGTITIASSAGAGGIVEGIALSAYTLGTGTPAANTTALQNAVNAAKSANKPLINDLGGINFQISSRIDMTGDGFSARFNGLRLSQQTANTGCVRFGGEGQDIDALSVYCPTNPSSTDTNANGFEFTNCFVCRYTNLVAENTARGLYMPQEAPTIGSSSTNTVFSTVFENIRINGWSISAIDFRTWLPGSASSTGNAWINIYCHNNFFGSAAACSSTPVIFRAWDESIFNQINVEWCLPPGEAIFMQECRNMLFQSVHFEGITLTGNNALLRAYSDTRVTIHTVSSMTTTIADNTGQKSIFKGYSNGSGNPFSLDVTSVRIRNTQNTGSRPFALFELESGSTGGDIDIRKADTGQLVGAAIIDPTGVVPSQINSYNGIILRTLVAPNVDIDKIRTTDAATITSSTTLVTDGTMQFAGVAGTYIVSGTLIYSCPAAADLKYRFNYSAAGTGKLAVSSISAAATTAVTTDGNFGSVSINADQTAGGVDSLETAILFRGVLTLTAAGTFSIQYAQSVSNATGLIIKATSHLSYRRVS